MSRSTRRSTFDLEQRVGMLENDLDDSDRKLERHAEIIEGKLEGFIGDIDKRDEKMDQRIGRITSLLVGMLISLTTAAVLLALNIAFVGAG